MSFALSKIVMMLALFLLASARSQYKVTSSSCDVSSCLYDIAYTGSDDYYVSPKNAIVKNIKVVFQALTFSDFTIKLTDPKNKRFEVPQGNGFPEDPAGNFTFPLIAAGYVFTYTSQPFDFRISRRSNNNTIFSTYDQDIIYSDYYLQIGTQIQSDFIYGLGQRFTSNFRVKNGKWTMFNRDHPFFIDEGTGQQTYGYYPYYINREKDNYFHATYFRSSNAMDAVKEEVSGKTYLTFKVIGGVIDLRFIMGDRHEIRNVVSKINDYAGLPNVPPFWSLGFHQCRWGYEDSSQLLQVLQNYEKNGIPLDTIWTDIDYMLDFEDFTIDEQNFPLSDMKKIQENYRYIPIIDAGIKIQGIAFEEGTKRNVFVNDAVGKPFIGSVWPGQTTFVDFFHPNATKYWGDMLNLLYEKVKFDGVWLDMNELSNFCNGPCKVPEVETVFDYAHDLPYHPGSSKIQDGTISLNATHYNGYKEADVHIFNAYLQTKATNAFLASKNVRPFIVSRSSTLGSTKYGNHWTGDNAATWQFLQGSISNIFNSHLNGFRMVGEDICGFAGNTTEELCARWYQLGTLYPFSRSHNAYGSEPQQPYALGEIVLKAATKAIKLRYSMLKYLYTSFLTQDFPFVWQPLYFAFPTDPKNYNDEIVNTEFILNGEFLVAPIIVQGDTSRTAYFPMINWYDLFSGKRFPANQSQVITNQLTDIIPIFLGEGYSTFLQNAQSIRNTKQLNNKFSLYSAFILVESTKERTVYKSSGSILSISDPNNETNIQKCIQSKRCSYQLVFTLTVQANRKTLSIVTAYDGPIGFNDQLQIENFHLYFGEQVVRFTPEKSLIISKDKEQINVVVEQNQVLQVIDPEAQNLQIE